MKKKRKLFYATAATAIISSAIAGAASAEVSFSDVKKSNAHHDAIKALTEQGVIKGFPDGTYQPNKEVTRGQAAKIIVQAFNLSVLDPKPHNFTDVDTSNVYSPYVATLKELGIIQGKADGTFGVNEPITREQMAKMISLAIGLESDGQHPFKDVPKNSASNGYISALYKHNIAKGTTATKFSPAQKVTRGQFASFVHRAQAHAPNKSYTLSVLHTNDMHSRVEAMPKLYTAIQENRAVRPNTLLLDAGDSLTGTLYFNEFQGAAEQRFLNSFGYDAATFGNHEFDLGSSADGHKKLQEYVAGMNFPFVSANVNFNNDSKFTGMFSNTFTSTPKDGNIYAGIVKEIDGEKVGIFGLTTAETKDISSPGSITFENYIDKAEAAVEALEKQGVNKIIALSHLGYDDSPAYDNDQLLAKAVEGIDIIVGGHSHTELKAPVSVTTNTAGADKEPTLIVQAYQYGDFLGTLDVQFNEEGVIYDYRGSLLKVADFAANDKALEMLNEFKPQIDAVSNSEIGISLEQALANPRASETSPESVRKNETILGNLITDGMYSKAQNYSAAPVIMAVQNGGGIRAAINEGPVTVGEVITVLPFGNTLALVNLTGAEIKTMFETSVKGLPSESGAFLHVSGAKVTYDSSKPAGERVVSIQYKNNNGEYVNVEATSNYVIATNAFTAKGGDNFEVLAKAYSEGRVTDLGLSDWENFANHLKSLTTIPTTTESRLVDLNAAK